MMEILKDKIAVVTGAATGIGACIADMIAAQGASVSLWDIANLVEETAKKICDSGKNAKAFKVDIGDSGQVIDAARAVLEEFGRVDILVNNAGIYPSVMFVDATDEVLEKCWTINAKGTWNCTKAILPAMIERKSGKIINISSVTGPLVSVPGYTPYAMTKGAISAFTRTLALEVGQHGINVNAILPGSIETHSLRELAIRRGQDPDEDMRSRGKGIPLGRLGTGNDIGGAVIFLASDYSDYITGAELVVDGGNVIQEYKLDR